MRDYNVNLIFITFHLGRPGYQRLVFASGILVPGFVPHILYQDPVLKVQPKSAVSPNVTTQETKFSMNLIATSLPFQYVRYMMLH